jgi:hypothetical protein
MFDYSEDRRILKQAINDNKLVVFVGAGASINSGIPLWKDAVEKIYDKIGNTSMNNNETLKIPQVYYNARGEKEYNELVKDIFKYDDKKPNDIHELIVKLNPCHVITTNYDDFLEKTFIANGEFLDVVQKDSEIPYCKNSRMIIKMHGGFIYNNFVLKEDDYLNYSKNFALTETFIKALIAKNIVLFVGYSYNDPDTKQIFTWAKNILGDNFQRAYFLDARNYYDLNTVNYYKNLGINIIYASENIIDDFSKDNIFENTVKLLKYIINDEQETDITNRVYNSYKNLVGLNYILTQYVTPVLWDLGVIYENGNLELINDKSKELFKTLNANITQEKSIQFDMIKEVLDKTIIKNVYINEEKSFNKKILCSFKGYSDTGIYKEIDNQNYINIKQYSDSLNMLMELDNEQQLCNAYCYYELQEYKKCYAILKKLSLSFKQQQNYIWYFITEFNRFYIGKLISSNLYFDTNNELKNEIEKIDLSNILYSNALKGKNENQFLKELEDFNLVYKTLSKVLKAYEKVEKDTITNFAFGAGIAKIDVLENIVKDFYNYLKFNYLMINEYAEVIEVYKQYINAVFFSHSKEEKEFSDGIFGAGKNKVLKEISPFAIMIVCKYIDKKNLEEIFQKNFITKIELSNDAEVIIHVILHNYFDAIENNIQIRNIKNKIFVILKILGFSNLSKDRMTYIINVINNLIAKNFFENTEYLEISNFIVNKHNGDKTILDSESLISILNIICNGFRLNSWESTDLSYLHTLFRNVSSILKVNYPKARIQDVFSEAILNSNSIEFFPELYSVVSNKIKTKIKREVVLKLEDNNFNYELYYHAINAGIINKSKEMEDKLFNRVEKIYYEQSPSIKSFPDPLKSILSYSIFLLLNDNLIEKDRFRQYFKGFPETEFLYDMDNFNYDKFDISWFSDSNEALKSMIIKNKIAFKGIKKVYRNALTSKDYNYEILNEYLKYFDKA